MQVDLQLRADARAAYEARALWKDQPTFEQAERLRLPSYLDAVALAQDDRAVDREIDTAARQLVML